MNTRAIDFLRQPMPAIEGHPRDHLQELSRELLTEACTLDGSDREGEHLSARELHAATAAVTDFIRQHASEMAHRGAGAALEVAGIKEQMRAIHATNVKHGVTVGESIPAEHAVQRLYAGMQAALAQEQGHFRSPEWVREADLELPITVLPQPEYWGDSNVYHLVLDRFSNGNPKTDGAGYVEHRPDHPDYAHGGDIKGVTAQLDYLEKLGVKTVWLGPITAQFGPMAYHNYHTYDFFKMDPRVGSLADMRELCDEAHKRGIRIILDVVWQHTAPLIDYEGDDISYRPEGREYRFRPGAPQLKPNDMVTHERPYHGRGVVEDWLDPEQRIYGDFRTRPEEEARLLPTLDTSLHSIQQTMAAQATYFIKTTGVDAIRLDTAGHFPPADHKAIKAEIEYRLRHFSLDPVIIVPEQYHHEWQAQFPYVKSVESPDAPYDSTLNFPQNRAFQRAFKWGEGTRPLESALVEQNKLLDPRLPLNFVDNHDRARWLHRGEGDTRSREERERELEAALTLMYAWPGIPTIYYGTEQGFEGGEDPGNRESMFGQHNPDSRLAKFLRSLNELRVERPELRRGDAVTLWSEDGPLFALARVFEGSAVVCAANTSGEERAGENLPVAHLGVKEGQKFRDHATGLELVATKEAGKVVLPLPTLTPHQTLMLLPV